MIASRVHCQASPRRTVRVMVWQSRGTQTHVPDLSVRRRPLSVSLRSAVCGIARSRPSSFWRHITSETVRPSVDAAFAARCRRTGAYSVRNEGTSSSSSQSNFINSQTLPSISQSLYLHSLSGLSRKIRAVQIKRLMQS